MLVSCCQQGDTKPPLNSASLQPAQDLWSHTRSSGSTQAPRGRAEKPFHGVACSAALFYRELAVQFDLLHHSPLVSSQ